MIGPVLGGYLMEHASWRAVFYINVPVGILGLILAYLVLPTPHQREQRRLDIAGMSTMALFLLSFLMAMSQGREEGWDSPYILTLLIIALIAGVSFVLIELHSPQPFVELRLYKNLRFAMASMVVFINTLSFMATNFIVALFLQIHLDYTPLQAAWILMPSAIVIGIFSVISGRLSDFIPAKTLVIFGLGSVSWCLFKYAAITPATSIAMITFWMTARGFARAFTIAPLSAVSLAALPETELRMGSGLLSLNRGIASAGSVALAATIFQNRLGQRAQMLVQDQSVLPFGSTELLQNTALLFERLGDFSQVATTKSLAMLHHLVTMEAALHSYHDTFLLIGLVSAAGMIPALWLGKRQPLTCQPSHRQGAGQAEERAAAPR
jgi:EmrB/QacA subfamily drug resistance transporter